MINPKNRIFSSLAYGLGFILILSLFYFIKFKGHLFTEYSYQKQAFDILNKITDAHDIKSLDFYIGEIEKVKKNVRNVFDKSVAKPRNCAKGWDAKQSRWRYIEK